MLPRKVDLYPEEKKCLMITPHIQAQAACKIAELSSHSAGHCGAIAFGDLKRSPPPQGSPAVPGCLIRGPPIWIGTGFMPRDLVADVGYGHL